MISAIVDDIGAAAEDFLASATYATQTYNFGMGDAQSGAAATYQIGQEEGPPGWLSTLASTGLEAFRVREGRRAMTSRPLNANEMSLYTRGNNVLSLSPFGNISPLVLGAGIFLGIILLRR